MQTQDTMAAVVAADETTLRAALAGGFRPLRQLPPAVEAAFARYRGSRATVLLRQAIYGLIALYLLVVVPIYLFSDDPAMVLWETYAMAPIGVVLALLWGCTRLPALDRHVEAIIGLSLYICLVGTLYCSMRLDGQYFGKMAAFETIYILIVTLTILQLAPRVALPAALLAFSTSLLSALASGLRPSLLEMLLYFVVPLLICLVTGYMLDHSERRNFVQNLLLNSESRRLAQLHADAEETMRQQRYTTDFLTLIGGNLTLRELFTRTLRFLADQSGAQVGVAYHLDDQGLLRLTASWAVAGDTLAHKDGLVPGQTLMGPALKSGDLLHLQAVRADYLPLQSGVGTLPCAAVLVLPIVLAGRPLGVIELGRLAPFGAREQRDADSIRTHLAYAIAAAAARAPAPAPASAPA